MSKVVQYATNNNKIYVGFLEVSFEKHLILVAKDHYLDKTMW
jgi:hypothetical protein